MIRGIKLYQYERLKILFPLLLKSSISFSSLSLKCWMLIAMETLSAHRHDNRGSGCTLKINSPNQVEIRQILCQCKWVQCSKVTSRWQYDTETVHTLTHLCWKLNGRSLKNRWKNIEQYSTALKVRSAEIKLFLIFWNKGDEMVL